MTCRYAPVQKILILRNYESESAITIIVKCENSSKQSPVSALLKIVCAEKLFYIMSLKINNHNNFYDKKYV